MCHAVSEAEEGSKAAELPFHTPNVWPDPNDAPLFRPAFTAYRTALVGVRDK
jgi:isopenicillin N synthase-like dioxygenase